MDMWIAAHTVKAYPSDRHIEWVALHMGIVSYLSTVCVLSPSVVSDSVRA